MAIKESLLTEELKKHFGFEQFKGQQEEIINSILNKQDTFVIMPTGGGKSLCYQLPAIVSEGTAIVISPLIALMKNQVDLVRGYSSNDNIAHFLNSSLNKAQIANVKTAIRDGHTKILYVAPESLIKEEYVEFLSSVPISFVAVDEAHCISEWGHDFRPEYRKIRLIIDNIQQKIPIMALTATATPKVQSDIVKTLKMQNPKVYISSFLRSNLYYEVRPKLSNESAIKDIIKFIKHPETGRSGIIYCLSRKSTEDIANILRINGINAAAYHAGLDASVRNDTQDKFLMEEIDVIVATIAFGMGIDKPDVRFVVHYDIPKSLENYYQETGRAGRDGLDGKCIAYFAHKDIDKLEKFMRDKPVAEREITAQHLSEVTAYAETSECRKEFVLHYFGESHTCAREGYCDNCKTVKEKTEVKDSIKLVIETVAAVNEQCKINYIIHLITGKKSKEVMDFRHDVLPLFGKGKDHDSLYWNTVIRKALLEGLIEKEIELYGVLKISEKGHAYIKNPYSISIVLNHTYPEGEDSDDVILNSGKGEGNAVDPQLFNLLKDLRKRVAKQKSLPPYVLFQDPSLEDMATQYPITLEELGNISGVSMGKAQKYGKEFVELIKKYVEENDIDRPSDYVVKSVVNKSGQKVAIIQNVDKKIPLDAIASSRSLSMEKLLEELYSIVSSGTKIDIRYYINNVIDEDAQDIIMEYFMEAESDDVEEAYKELKAEDIEMEEILLMRIKFLSEVAN
jgi:ATP-dependent DNA helicase RecQ